MESEVDRCLAAALPHIREFTRRQDAENADMGGGRPAAELLDLLDGHTLPHDAAGNLEGFSADIGRVLTESVATGHPMFLDKLYARPTAEGLVGDLVLSLLNSNAHTYAVAPVLMAVEVATGRALRRLFGYSAESGDAIFCPGGSHCNLLAMSLARHRAFPHVRQRGLAGGERPAVFTSAQSHFSVKRAAVILGVGEEAVRPVAADVHGRMRADALADAVDAAKRDGMHPFFLSATAGTTVMGGFDDIGALADVAARHGMWLHVDGAWGGLVRLSPSHAHLMDGLERSDSLALSFHKMAGAPIQCAALLVNGHDGLLADANATNADYLFHDHDDAAFDVGDRTLQCGRRGDALKLWLAWRRHGTAGIIRRVDNAMDAAAGLVQEVCRRAVRDGTFFPVLTDPQFANVPFWAVPPHLRRRVRDIARVSLAAPDPAAPRGPGPQPTAAGAASAALLGSDLAVALGHATAPTYEALRRRKRVLVNFNPLADHGLPPFFRAVFNSPAMTPDKVGRVLDEVAAASDDAAASA